jgi:hypothetical protein
MSEVNSMRLRDSLTKGWYIMLKRVETMTRRRRVVFHLMGVALAP